MKRINRFGGRKSIVLIVLVITASIILLLTVYMINTRPYKKTFENVKIFSKPSVGTNTDLIRIDETVHLLPLKIQATGNFMNFGSGFSLDKDTIIRIFCIGEGADYSINPDLFQSYDNDGIEIFFDMKNDKLPSFDINGDDRQYRILWKSLKVDGKNVDTIGIYITERDPDSDTYVLRISFPWKSLGFIRPVSNSKIGFDISIIDCDGGTRKGVLTWHSNSGDNWKNTSLYGTLTLKNSLLPTINSDSEVFAKRIYNTDRNKIFVDANWTNLPAYYFRHVTSGYVENESDLSGNFKALWDTNNLYLLVSVKDNIKSMAKAVFDYGWIEDSARRIVWRMDVDRTKYAGGALKNRIIDTCIKIKKGKYMLRYITDESHSPSQWDDLPPNDPFYGIRVSYN